MEILVSDTSVVIDLERAQLVEEIFALPYDFIVPDILYDLEMRSFGGERLLERGLQVRKLTGAQVAEAQRLRALQRKISVSDSYALSLARAEGSTLLAGDGALRVLAEAEGVRCHGVLWVFDRLEDSRFIERVRLHEGLTRIAGHPRCRLPRAEVALRLARFLER